MSLARTSTSLISRQLLTPKPQIGFLKPFLSSRPAASPCQMHFLGGRRLYHQERPTPFQNNSQQQRELTSLKQKRDEFNRGFAWAHEPWSYPRWSGRSGSGTGSSRSGEPRLNNVAGIVNLAIIFLAPAGGFIMFGVFRNYIFPIFPGFEKWVYGFSIPQREEKLVEAQSPRLH